MTLSSFRRSSFVGALTTVCFIATILPPRPARADLVSASVAPAASPGASMDQLYGGSAASIGVSQGANGAVADARVDPQSGALNATIAIETPAARGAAQLGLAVQYNSNGGVGLVARGWSLNIPAIERHNPSGPPTFNDPPGDPSAASVVPGDRMTYGGAPLVPICIVGAGANGCANLLINKDDPKPEQFPSSLNGYYYFRLERESGELLRFFWSSNHGTWIVQSPGGITEEFGAPASTPADTAAIDFATKVTCREWDTTEPGLCNGWVRSSLPYRWNLRRKYDAQRFATGTPTNPIEYVWGPHPEDAATGHTGTGLAYLFDIYDTAPPTPNAALDDYAHHVHFTYAYQNGLNNHTKIWRAGHRFALSRVDVTSARFTEKVREQVRRYRFDSTAGDSVYELTNVGVEGQCDNGTPNPTESNGLLPETGPICARYPGNQFFYQSSPLNPSVVAVDTPLPSDAPPTVLDVNSDGLPDLVAVATSASNPAIALNPGPTGTWTQSTISFLVSSTLGADPSSFTPSVPSYISGNWAGDGRTNILWLDPSATTQNPLVARTSNDVGYEIYTPISTAGSWAWNFPYAGTGTFRMKAHVPQNPTFQRDDRMPDPDKGGPPVYAACGRGIVDDHPSTPQKQWNTAMDADWGFQSKFMTADIDGDGFSDIVTTRPLINSACHQCNGINGWLPCCKFEADGKRPSGADDVEWFGYACQEDVLQTSRYFVQQTTRLPDGTIEPFAGDERGFCVGGNDRTEEVLGVSRDNHNPTWSSTSHGDPDPHLLLDVSGDGLADWVQLTKDHLVVFLGHGNGVFGTCDDGTLDCGEAWMPLPDHSVRGFPESPCGDDVLTPEQWPGIPGVADMTKGRLHDVDADSNVDFILVHDDTGTIDVYLGLERSFATHPITIDFAKMARWAPASLKDIPGTRSVRVLFADMNGSGTDDIVVESRGAVAYADLYGTDRPRLLSALRNDLGVVTTVTYRSTAVLDSLSRQTPSPWTKHSPQSAHVVTETVTANAFPTADLTNFEGHTSYIYQNPIYDGRDRSIVGFDSVAVGQTAKDQPTATYVKTTYFNGQCGSAAFPCAGSGTADYMPGALRGLAVLTEVYDTNRDNQWAAPQPANYLSTTHTSFSALPLYKGLDGRQVRRVYANQSDTWFYDTSPFSSAPSTSTDLVDVSYKGGTFPATFTVRSSKAQHVRSLSWADPWRGILFQTIDYGRVDASGRTLDDSTIETTASMDLAPGCDTGWTWRTTGKTITGRNAAGIEIGTPRVTSNTYDAFGNILTASSVLSGALPLVRSHAAAGADFAKDPPPNAAPVVPTNVVFGQYAYSSKNTGQLTRSTTANGRCEEIEYDALYDQLLTKRRVPLDGCDPSAPTTGGTHQLISQVTSWNRGFQTATGFVDPSGASTNLTLDGLGRVHTIAPPDATIPGASSPSTTIDYGTWGFVRQIHTTTALGYEAWAYVDGFGRRLLTVTRADANDDHHPYIVSGQTRYDSLGRAVAAYQPWFFDGSPANVPLTAPSAKASTVSYDSFGRVVASFALDGTTQTGRVEYKGLTTNVYDGSEISGVANADHVGAYFFSVSDGHGRTISSGSVGKDSSGKLTTLTTTLKYQPTGEVTSLSRTGNYTRTMQYDSWGRMVQNSEPNTSYGFDPNGQSAALSAWRYAYDADGHLVGTSDARGCGKNLWYDLGDRLVAEDFSPCLASQPAYTRPVVDGAGHPSGDNTERFYVYDRADGAGGAVLGQGLLPSGRLNETFDRASHTTYHHDARGRVTTTTRSLAKPGDAAPLLSNRYTPHEFRYDAVYDNANRLTDQSTGADVPGILALDGPEAGSSWTHFRYSPTRGTLQSVGSSYGGDLVSNITYDVAGPLHAAKLNDAGKTTIELGYSQVHGWLSSIYIHRDVVAPKVLQQTILLRDNVGRPTLLADARNAQEWTVPGSLPVTSRVAKYDDFGRLTSVDAAYGAASADDTWVEPNTAVLNAPPRPLTPAKRVRHQEFTYSALGDLASSDDNEHAFLDRSFGTASFGTSNAGPNQLQSSTGIQVPGEDSAKTVNVFYDRAGNVSSIDDGRKSYFSYDWDEIGSLQAATRWDYVAHKPKATKPGGPICDETCTPPVTTYTLDWNKPAVRFRYAYDAAGNRVLRSELDVAGNTQWTNAEVFPSLRLNHATWDTAANDYERDSSETAYLFAGAATHARVVSAQFDPITGTSGHQHVLFELSDHLGSSSTIIDKDTGELVEQSTYLPYGGPDSDYRPSKWAGFREDYRFTGKESDVEVGLIYFGARYYSPGLGRFVSPDPLAIHAGGGDLNPYAYVRGSPFALVDPTGLDDCDNKNSSCNVDNTPITPPPCDGTIATCGGGSGGGGNGGGNRNGVGDGINHSVHPSTPLSNSDALPARNVGPTNVQLRPNMTFQRETSIDPAEIDGERGTVLEVVGNTKITYYGTPVPPPPHVGHVDHTDQFLKVATIASMAIPESGVATEAVEVLDIVIAGDGPTVTLYHGTTASAAARIVAKGFRPGVDGAVYFAEDYSTAAHFAEEAMAARGASGGTILRFTVPADVAAGMERGFLGAARGAPAIDILGGSGYEMVLEAGRVGAFNTAVQDGTIGVTRLRLIR